jgi:hypothetical protein
MAIHTPIESSIRVDKKYFVFENIYCDFWPKEAKKQREKMYVLNDVWKNRVLGNQTSTKRSF